MTALFRPLPEVRAFFVEHQTLVAAIDYALSIAETHHAQQGVGELFGLLDDAARMSGPLGHALTAAEKQLASGQLDGLTRGAIAVWVAHDWPAKREQLLAAAQA